ncbi:MAG: hypothetical protein FWG82_00320 [Oscillospiraceae bacterium]|nr:hypothetical protein [Oscillospiraceae bacterium]
MSKQKKLYLLLFAVIALFSVSVISACNTSSPAVELPPRFASYLGDGLTFVATPKQYDDGIYLDISIENDTWKYQKALPFEKSPFVLVHKATGERVEALPDAVFTVDSIDEIIDSDEQNKLHEKQVYRTSFKHELENLSLKDFSQYTLEYDLSVSLGFNDKINTNLPLPKHGKLEINKHKDFQDGHFITVNSVEVIDANAVSASSDKANEMIFDFDENYFAVINFAHSDNLHFDMPVLKARVVRGSFFILSNLKEIGKNHYEYYHPIKDDETELVIGFENINYYKDFKGTAEFVD